MKVPELRALLSQRGLSNVGAKQDLVERLATAAAGATEETQEERHAGAFQDSSATRLDTAAFSMAATEESTPITVTVLFLLFLVPKTKIETHLVRMKMSISSAKRVN
jgi:hypothetical protein